MIRRLQQGWQHPGWLNRIVLPVAWVYAGLMWCRRRAYRIGLLNQHKIPVVVIVVGNISVGGTGKTPLVIALVEFLGKSGFRPGVIARGYKGGSGFWPRAIDANDTAEVVGDEPLMVSLRCKVPVVVGPDRVRSAHMLVEKYQCDVVVSDDGYQHLALARDIDIVVIDGERGFGNSWCLPAGPLREIKHEADRADIQVVNSPRGRVPEQAVSMQIEPGPVEQLDDRECKSGLESFAGQAVHAVAALGNPERFYDTLRAAGLDIIVHSFPDHHVYRPEDFAFAGEQDVVIMTEKDAIKCLGLDLVCRTWVLPIRARPSPAFFEKFQLKLDHAVTAMNRGSNDE